MTWLIVLALFIAAAGVASCLFDLAGAIILVQYVVALERLRRERH